MRAPKPKGHLVAAYAFMDTSSGAQQADDMVDWLKTEFKEAPVVVRWFKRNIRVDGVIIPVIAVVGRRPL